MAEERGNEAGRECGGKDWCVIVIYICVYISLLSYLQRISNPMITENQTTDAQQTEMQNRKWV